MPIGNRVKTDDLLTSYTTQAYPLGTLYTQLARDVNGVDLAQDDGTAAFTVDTPAAANLQAGERVWVFVQAATAVAAGDLCKINAGTTPYVVAKDAADSTYKWLLRGVAQSAIGAGEYGWIVCKGTVVAQANASVAAGNILASYGSSGAAGQVNAYTFTPGTTSVAPIVGIALDAEDATSRYGAGYCQAAIDLL